jgi:hypothetical protein
MRRHVDIRTSLLRRWLGPYQGAHRLSRISRAVLSLSSSPRPNRVAVRASLVLLVFSMSSAIGGIGQSADAAVFTDLSLPTISGKAVEGQTLTEGHATWSSPPSAYAYQWQRCNSVGSRCESISKARTQSYVLTAADVGSTIRVGESARDAEGAVTPSLSEPTAVVQAQAASEHSGGGGGGGPSGGGPPVSCCEQPGHVDAAAIKTLLARLLVPSGKAASISVLLRHGGMRSSFKFPEAGALVVKWYLVRPGRKLKPMAVGQATFTAGETVGVSMRLTAGGRALLRHASKLQLEATGTFTPKGEKSVAATKKFTLRR